MAWRTAVYGGAVHVWAAGAAIPRQATSQRADDGELTPTAAAAAMPDLFEVVEVRAT